MKTAKNPELTILSTSTFLSTNHAVYSKPFKDGVKYAVKVFGFWIPAKAHLDGEYLEISREHRELVADEQDHFVAHCRIVTNFDLLAGDVRVMSQEDNVVPFPPAEPPLSDLVHRTFNMIPAVTEDVVRKPAHYAVFADKSKQAMDIIQDTLTDEEFIGYLKGNILKYRLRAGEKDDTLQDIAKAQQYNHMLGHYIIYGSATC
jgi:hypothetical protein